MIAEIRPHIPENLLPTPWASSIKKKDIRHYDGRVPFLIVEADREHTQASPQPVGVKGKSYAFQLRLAEAPDDLPLTIEKKFLRLRERVVENSEPTYTVIETVTLTFQFAHKGMKISPVVQYLFPAVIEDVPAIAAGAPKQTVTESLIPLEMAPEVLAVNSDFDEGRIDPDTGYAIPDCDDLPAAQVDRKTGAGNGELRIDTERDHLDGLYVNDERVTDDMHKGWFGVNPLLLDDEFWDGGSVTITKIDKIDPDTGKKESGQIRFYSTVGEHKFRDYYGIKPYDFATLQATNLVTGGVNKRPQDGVYGSLSTISLDSDFYMEGVRPGKITLEWKFHKGSLDVRHEQTFLVATYKSKEKWLEEVYYQIKLQSSDLGGDILSNSIENDVFPPRYLKFFPLDLNHYDPKNGFRRFPDSHNYIYIQIIYYYYMQIFDENPEELYWAGMAKAAGAAVYAGMVDMNAWREYSLLVGTPFAQRRITKLDQIIEGFLLAGNRDIFNDMSWSHHAYASSGLWAINHLENEQINNGTIDAFPYTDYRAWDKIDQGIKDGVFLILRDGNKEILRREQEIVMQPLYTALKTIWLDPGNSFEEFVQGEAGFEMPSQNSDGYINIDDAFSLNARNPIEIGQGPMFRTTVPGGSLSSLDDRWSWISNPQSGMLEIWLGTSQNVQGFTATTRMNINRLNFTGHANLYSISKAFPPGL